MRMVFKRQQLRALGLIYYDLIQERTKDKEPEFWEVFDKIKYKMDKYFNMRGSTNRREDHQSGSYVCIYMLETSAPRRVIESQSLYDYHHPKEYNAQTEMKTCQAKSRAQTTKAWINLLIFL